MTTYLAPCRRCRYSTRGTHGALLTAFLAAGLAWPAEAATLVHRWDLSDGSGTTVTSQVGSVNGTINGSMTWTPSAGLPATNVPPVFSPGVFLSSTPANSNNFVNFGNQSSYTPGNITVAFWAKQNAAAQNQTLLSKYHFTDTLNQGNASNHPLWSWEFSILSGTSNLGFRVSTGGGTVINPGRFAANPFTPAMLSDGNWHFIVGTHEYAAGVAKTSLYVDGELVETIVTTGSGAGPIQNNSGANVPLYLGRRPTSGLQHAFNGSFSGPLLIYDGALSLQEIQQLYTIPEPSSLLLGMGVVAIALRRRNRPRR